MDDDDDNNNIVNNYKITGGKNNGVNNEAFTHKRMYKARRKSCITSRVGKKIRHLGNVSFYYYGQNRVIQCVLENELAGYKVDVESVVHVIGEIVETTKTELGVELLAHEVKVINGAEPLPFEINKKKLQVGLDQLLNERVLSLRHERTAAIFKVKSTLVQSFSEFLIENDFTRIFTPKIVSQGAEGGANVLSFHTSKKKRI